jgi:hypothetical protein
VPAPVRRPSAPPAGPRIFKPGWPLVMLYAGFPLWWALGLAQLIFFMTAAAMTWYLVRNRKTLVVPRGFSVWVLFLLWMLAGVFVVRAVAPGTVPGAGLGKYAGFMVWSAWYFSVTVALLYVVNTARLLSTLRIIRLLGWMFVVTAAFGVLAVAVPMLEFKSAVELILPRGLASSNYVRTLVHPSLSSTSDFLGYVQPRPTAPFPYSNAWGNNLALYLPFFVLAWFGRDAGWRKKLAPFVLAGAIFPITFSLNRGLWGALTVAAVYSAVRLAVNGRTRALQLLVVSLVIGGIVFVSSPLYDTIKLRIETPHSNDRRGATATTVVSTTLEGSPVVGFGMTRKMQGSFSSLAGGETDECHQCAAPPLGTQGFMWRLILTTGIGGMVLCLTFLALQFLRRARGAIPLEVACCTVLIVACMCFFVYDSLGSAMFTVMIAIGLMARADLPADRPPAASSGVPAALRVARGLS